MAPELRGLRQVGAAASAGWRWGRASGSGGARSWIPRAQLPEDAPRVLLAYVTVQMNG